MTSLRLSLLVAMAKNRVIGRDNKLPWHLPDDLKHFKFLTMGKTIVMGRKTYESIGKPLPGRVNIIITRQEGYEVPGATVVSSIDDALLMCEKIRSINGENFIIGGEELYRQTLKICQRIYITEIQSFLKLILTSGRKRSGISIYRKTILIWNTILSFWTVNQVRYKCDSEGFLYRYK